MHARFVPTSLSSHRQRYEQFRSCLHCLNNNSKCLLQSESRRPWSMCSNSFLSTNGLKAIEIHHEISAVHCENIMSDGMIFCSLSPFRQLSASNLNYNNDRRSPTLFLIMHIWRAMFERSYSFPNHSIVHNVSQYTAEISWWISIAFNPFVLKNELLHILLGQQNTNRRRYFELPLKQCKHNQNCS